MNPTKRSQAPTRSLLGWVSRLPVQAWLGLAVLWVVIEMVALGRYSLIFVADDITVVPYLLAFFANDIPFSDWTPFPAAGTDMIATGHTTLIYRWMFGIFPPWLAFEISALGPVVAGVLGTYGLCRRVFELDELSSVFAGFAYGIFFASSSYTLTAVPGYLPLTILALSFLLDDKTDAKRWLAVAAAGFLISHTAYISRLVPWVAVTYFVWFLVIEKRRRPADWAIIIVFSIAVMAARWQDIIALLAYGPLSALPDFRHDVGLSGNMTLAMETTFAYLTGKGYLSLVFLAVFAISFNHNRRHKSLELLLAMAGLIVLLILAGLFKSGLVPLFPFLSRIAGEWAEIVKN